MNNVAGTVEASLTVFGGIDLELTPTDLPAGLSPGCSDVAFIPGSVFTRPPFLRRTTRGTTVQAVYNTSYTKPNGQVVDLVFYSDGGMYADGVLIGTTQPGNRFKTCEAFGRTYIAISDGLHGADVPLQLSADGHLDRVSQDGPGAASVFAASNLSTDAYPISTVTQPAQRSRGSSAYLQSTGPGSSQAGTVFTFYYAQASAGGPDVELVAQFNSGVPTYVYVEVNSGAVFSPLVVHVTNIGQGNPPGDTRSFYYFSASLPSQPSAFGENNTVTIDYWLTLATVTTTQPVPGLTVNASFSISGTSTSNFNSTWTVVQALDSGDLNITQTTLMGGVGSYSYTLSSGVVPTVGQTVTVTGTLNANGALNVTNGVIASVTTGVFTINGFSMAMNYPATAESGTGVTAGTMFTFDPGALANNTTTFPIYANSTGGNLTFAGSAVVVASGNRQGVVFFITRTDYTTKPSVIAKFTVPSNANAITVNNLPIGPANVIARGVAFTGANGGKFFYLPVQPLDPTTGLPLGTSTVVNDNVATTAQFQFTDQSLFAGLAIDIPGNNMFRQEVLGPCLGFFPYAGRLMAWGERNKIQQFNNMGFEGGYYGSSPNQPLGWTVSGAGTLAASGDYGMAYTFETAGMGGAITQGAYQDSFFVAILAPLTQYTFRAWTTGTITADFYSASMGVLATATITAQEFAQADFSMKTPAVIPADTVLRCYAAAAGTQLDEIEVIYTVNPYRLTARASYEGNPEAFDGVTGVFGPATDPHPVFGMEERRDVLCVLTNGPDGSLYETEDSASGEPSTWDFRHIASKCGLLSVWGTAKFEDFFCWISDTGLRIFDGGTVDKISQEVQTFWNSFNPAKWQYSVLANDPVMRRLYVSAVTGAATINNSFYVMDYRELNSAAALSGSGALHIGLQGGKVITTDLSRKWTPWSRPINHCGVVALASGGSVMTFCGGTGGALTDAGYSATYTLGEGLATGMDDDYGAFWQTSFYPTYFFLSADEAQQKQLGLHRLLHTFLTLNVSGNGAVTVTPLLNDTAHLGKTLRAVPMKLTPTYDIEYGLNLSSNRISYQIGCKPLIEGGPAAFSLSALTVGMRTDPFAPVRGWNS